MQKERTYWFPAKRVGWGWGLPTTWQGALVLVAFVVLMAVGMPLLRTSGLQLPYVALLLALLLTVCWLKGEPQRRGRD
ncbi:hypothetical protein DVT68_19385 [Dyella solisilvae]|uniref:Uncharacterized protein n=1 Tax=Dyella solisilvae TaxID=1920168 RepID=A0A370K4E1_9GAMM|nr:hypothetical protein [Dyella solisilvae]RDI96890.1 hypothetical protein DVT68_19385 [Dyella solisilvae]